MFGNKNRMKPEEIENMKEQLEQKEDFFNRVAAIRGMCEANISEISSSRKQTDENLNQIARNVDNVIGQSIESIEMQATLTGDIRQITDNLASTNEEYLKLVERIREDGNSLMKMVDGNKHYTTPSKFIKEYPNKTELRLVKCVDYTAQMSEFRKQMGVLALNAAIEAGRMGDAGKKFVDAAEDIRAYTSGFVGVVSGLEQELDEAKKENEELKSQVSKLIKLIKDNNVVTANLMKKCIENISASEQISILESVNDVSALKDKIIDITNTQEEILKEEERNKLQIQDIYSEFELQQNHEKELYDALLPILRETK